MTNLQKSPKNPKSLVLAERFGQLILKYMTRHGLSDDALVEKLKTVSGGMKGSLSRVGPHKQGTGGNPTPQTISIYQKALGIPQDEIDQLFVPDPQPQVGLPSAAQLNEQYMQLVASLQQQSNLPYEVQRDRLAAQAAIAADNLPKARTHLESVATATRRSAAHEVEEYARSLAALGALAFAELDYVDARKHYGEAIAFPNLSAERMTRYRRYYLIASNAVMARSKNPSIHAEMINAGVEPNEITTTTLMSKTADFAEATMLTAELREAGAFRGQGFYSAVFSKVGPDDDPVAVIDWYFKQDYRHAKSLEPVLRMYAANYKQSAAMEFVVRWPQLAAAARYLRLHDADFAQEIGRFLADDKLRPSALYAAGINHFNKREFPAAREYFGEALHFDTHPSRKEHIDGMIKEMSV